MGATLWTDPDFAEFASIWEPGQGSEGPAPILGWTDTTLAGIVTGNNAPIHSNSGVSGTISGGWPRDLWFGVVGFPLLPSDVIVYTLNWTTAFGDAAPVLTDDGDGKAYLTFVDRSVYGTSRGTATISVTVNGIPSDSVLGNIEIVSSNDTYGQLAWGPV